MARLDPRMTVNSLLSSVVIAVLVPKADEQGLLTGLLDLASTVFGLELRAVGSVRRI